VKIFNKPDLEWVMLYDEWIE